MPALAGKADRSGGWGFPHCCRDLLPPRREHFRLRGVARVDRAENHSPRRGDQQMLGLMRAETMGLAMGPRAAVLRSSDYAPILGPTVSRQLLGEFWASHREFVFLLSALACVAPTIHTMGRYAGW